MCYERLQSAVDGCRCFSAECALLSLFCAFQTKRTHLASVSKERMYASYNEGAYGFHTAMTAGTKLDYWQPSAVGEYACVGCGFSPLVCWGSCVCACIITIILFFCVLCGLLGWRRSLRTRYPFLPSFLCVIIFSRLPDSPRSQLCCAACHLDGAVRRVVTAAVSSSWEVSTL